jgi:prepilin-type N-terminal cleavage/methylation domain-containing protein
MRGIRYVRCGFTLLELLVVISIVALLLGLLIPAIHKTRQAAIRTACTNNLRQLGLASLNYHADNGCLPPGIAPFPDLPAGAQVTYFAHLLPYVEQDALYRLAKADVRALGTPVVAYRCPADGTAQAGTLTVPWLPWPYAFGTYAVNVQVVCLVDAMGEVINPRFGAVLPRDVPDGTSTTVLFAEKLAQCSNPDTKDNDGGCLPMYAETDRNAARPFYPAVGLHWGSQAFGRSLTFMVRTNPSRCDGTVASTPHEAMPVCMADGSVRHFSPDVSGRNWWDYLTPGGGEVVP